MTEDKSGQNGGAAPLPKIETTKTALVIAALGVVFGDIGTSPLYALRECFNPVNGIPVTEVNVLGVLSLVFWSLVLVVWAKYILIVMRADNKGEGGILALMTLVAQGREKTSRAYGLVVLLGIFGAALLYGDGIITPAISVLSAVEGLNVATDGFQPFIVPLSLAILFCLFVVQRRGTSEVGALFGPVLIIWFVTIGLLGLVSIVRTPSILAAVNPWHAVDFFLQNRLRGFGILGFVFLALTGVEMLFADLGHFGRAPIRLAWMVLVFPALLLNYFGQGAQLARDPAAVDNLFYRLAPQWMLYPLVVLSTVATVIASQAVISGAFSIARQTIQLGFWPRMRVIHTSAEKIGQVYIPFVNWALLVGTVILVMIFQKSGKLASAYGIAVSTDMLITTILTAVVVRKVWGIGSPAVLAVTLVFFAVDLAFFSSNVAKILTGGWIIMAIAGALYALMSTWRRGRTLLAERIASESLSIEGFIEDVRRHNPHRVPGIAVFLAGDPAGTPRALLHNYKHNSVIHEKSVILSVKIEEQPFVGLADRLQFQKLGCGFYRIILHYGFSESPDIPAALKLAPESEIKFEPVFTTFFLGRESLVMTTKPGLAIWRKYVFQYMSRNALDATTFFRLPVNRVIEVGLQVEM